MTLDSFIVTLVTSKFKPEISAFFYMSWVRNKFETGNISTQDLEDLAEFLTIINELDYLLAHDELPEYIAKIYEIIDDQIYKSEHE